MIAFELSLNGRKICTAGVGDHGVLSAHVTWVRRKGRETRSKKAGDEEEELTTTIGGLISRTGEHVDWFEPLAVKAGDEVGIKVVKADSVDQPASRRPPDSVSDEQERKRYVRQMAKEFGWKIVTR